VKALVVALALLGGCHTGTAKWFPLACYAATGITTGGALTVEDMYEPGQCHVVRLGEGR
jgi:hypothetical protein